MPEPMYDSLTLIDVQGQPAIYLEQLIGHLQAAINAEGLDPSLDKATLEAYKNWWEFLLIQAFEQTDQDDSYDDAED